LDLAGLDRRVIEKASADAIAKAAELALFNIMVASPPWSADSRHAVWLQAASRGPKVCSPHIAKQTIDGFGFWIPELLFLKSRPGPQKSS
jgi:hypothetical protein